MSRPNLVFIYADQLSYRAMGAYGNAVCRTPNMDRLANEGVVFDRFYASSALCGPSRFATYTGLTPFYNPNWANPNCAKLPFVSYMGDLFHQAGYHTGSIGKLHGMPEDFDFGFRHCRHNWSLNGPFEFNHYGQWVRQKLESRPDRRKLEDGFRRRGRDPFKDSDEDYYFLPSELSEEAWLLEEMDGFLDATPDGQPFMLNLCVQHPHQPWETIPEEDETYASDDIELPPNLEIRPPIVQRLEDVKVFDGRLFEIRSPHTPEEWKRFTARNYTSITQVDKAIGEILAELERRSLADNTLIVLNSDHGEMMGQFGRSQKMNLYEESIHGPFIVWGLDVPKGARRSQFGEQIDILPTLLDFAGAEIPGQLEGMSLKKAVYSGSAKTRDTARSWLEHNGFIHGMARSENYKLYRLTGINHRADTGEIFELYNVTEDPYETRDLWPERSANEELRRLKNDFCEYFWEKAGMIGCSLKTQKTLTGRIFR